MINFKKKKTNTAGSWTRQILCALLIGCSGLAVAGSVSAKDSAQQFSQRAGNAMNQALTHAHKGEHQKAIDVLQVELAGNDLSPAEFGVIYQMMGQYNYKLDRSDESITSFQNALRSGGLTPQDEGNLKLVVAQLMIGNGNYREGAERLEPLIAAGQASKPQYVDLLVNAWVQAEDYPRALPWAETWFEKAAPKEKRHYDLLTFLYNNLGMTEAEQKISKERADQGL